MKTSERFALNEWLTEYPADATYEDVLEMVRDDDERITVWQVGEQLGRHMLAETIDDLRLHFEYAVNPAFENMI